MLGQMHVQAYKRTINLNGDHDNNNIVSLIIHPVIMLQHKTHQ